MFASPNVRQNFFTKSNLCRGWSVMCVALLIVLIPAFPSLWEHGKAVGVYHESVRNEFGDAGVDLLEHTDDEIAMLTGKEKELHNRVVEKFGVHPKYTMPTVSTVLAFCFKEVVEFFGIIAVGDFYTMNWANDDIVQEPYYVPFNEADDSVEDSDSVQNDRDDDYQPSAQVLNDLS
eukprot:191169_1